MLANNDFDAYDPRGRQPFPKPQIDFVTPEPVDQHPLASQLYAAAWSMAVRDHELDKLFNFEFYEGK